MRYRRDRGPDAWSQFFLMCNAIELGRAGGMISQVKYFLHIKLWIVGEPGMMLLVK
jgi:hypothetical protein